MLHETKHVLHTQILRESAYTAKFFDRAHTLLQVLVAEDEQEEEVEEDDDDKEDKDRRRRSARGRLR